MKARPICFWVLLPALVLSLGNAVPLSLPLGNQADASQPIILDAWKRRIDQNMGVHAWNRKNDGMRVFQEWITLLTLAKSQPPDVQRKVGLSLQAYVVDENIGPLGFIGTSLPVPGLDQGDFDMTLLGCSSLIQLFLHDKLLLTDTTLVHLIKNVIRTWGQTPKAYFDILFVSIPETENHIFMTESTRYLTNQILFENSRQISALKMLRDSLVQAGVVIDNKQGMLKRLLLQVMQQAMCKGFFEFNAQIYQRFTIHALDNLYSFAEDPNIHEGSGCLLDYLSAVFAFQSIGAIRYGPFRRSSEVYLDSTLVGNDAACSFFAIQSGAFSTEGNPRKDIWDTHTAHSSMALFSSVLKYRIPDPILNYMQVRPLVYRAEIRSAYADKGYSNEPTELYSGGPGYLLTAGGQYQGFSGPNFPTPRFWFSDAPWVYDVITRSSSLILDPVHEKPGTLADILHFKGSHWRGNNMALYPNFLYGYAPANRYQSEEWPHQVPLQWEGGGEGPSDSARQGFALASAIAPLNAITKQTFLSPDFEFRFLDRSKSGVYIVLSRLRPAKTFFRWRHQKYIRGTLEVVDTSKVRSLVELKDRMLILNTPIGSRDPSQQKYIYVNIDGDRIFLNPRFGSEKEGILKTEPKETVLNQEIRPNLGFEPHFQVEALSPWKGKVAVSDGHGSLFLFNPNTGSYGIANFREWWNPERIWVDQTLASRVGPSAF